MRFIVTILLALTVNPVLAQTAEIPSSEVANNNSEVNSQVSEINTNLEQLRKDLATYRNESERKFDVLQNATNAQRDRLSKFENEIDEAVKGNSIDSSANLEKLKQELQTLNQALEARITENSKMLQLVSEKSGAESDVVKDSIDKSNASLQLLQNNLRNLENGLESKLSALTTALAANAKKLEDIDINFRTKLQATDETTTTDITNLQDSVNRYWGYWLSSTVLLGLLLAIQFLKIRKFSTNQLELSNTRPKGVSSEQEAYVQTDDKILDLISSQLTAINDEDSGAQEEENHTLALKVADEITRIQKNLSGMDEGTKGLKQLSASVTRIQDNFAANGYEIVDMLGKSYSEGMKVSANLIPDENLKPGQQIITRIIKPQVNYKGVMIQSAQIEVSQGE